MKKALLFLSFALPIFLGAMPARAVETPSLVVTTTSDTSTDTDNRTSLREALAYAAALGGPRTITFSNSTAGGAVNFFSAVPRTITLNGSSLSLTSSVTIQGPGANKLTVDANSQSAIFIIGANQTVAISGLTMSHGGNNAGGAIFNDGSSLSLSACALSGNFAAVGGAIYNYGRSGRPATLTINNSTFSGNHASILGGGIDNDAAGGNATLTISNSTFSGNSSDNSGGGIFNAEDGGMATVTISNTTLSGNSAESGGAGIGNGGIGNGGFGNGGTAKVTIGNSILANSGASSGNYLPFSTSATVTSIGGNVFDDYPGFFSSTDQSFADVKLGPLADYGGPTKTVALLPGSAAIDAGNNAQIPLDPATNLPYTTDQRGQARIQKGLASPTARVDSGAYELFPAPTLTQSTFNAISGGSAIDLAAATGASPAGGAFSGYGVANGFFDPTDLLGSYTLTYTLSDGHGGINSATFTITVLDSASLVVATTSDTSTNVALTTLVHFTGTSGANPGTAPGFGQLVQGSDGNFYGMTQQGGTSNLGTVFKMTPAGVQTTLVHFTGTGGTNPGSTPNGSLVQGSDGNFYGMTQQGGANNLGTIFKMTATGLQTTLVHFTGTGGANPGSNPYGSLVQGSDGDFYGMTQQGGTSNLGTIFKMTAAGVQATLVHFTGTGGANPGSNPYGSLVQGSDGNFYGMTYGGGASGNGTIFKMTAAGLQTTLVHFTGSGGANPGSHPYGGLMHGTDGNFYGMTWGGGTIGNGTIFKITAAGVRTTLVNFTGSTGANLGWSPYGSLVQGNDGNFYGTSGGGPNGLGTVFQMTAAGVQTTLVNFTNSGALQGQYLYGSLVQGRDGSFYGMTQQGGTSNKGTVFKISSSMAVAEGAAATQTGIFFDPNGNETVTLTASSGVVTQDNAAGTWSWTAPAADGPAGSAITITAADTAGVTATAGFTFTITNVVPTVAIAAPAASVTGIATGFTFTATDPGPADQAAGFAWTVNYGDGSAVVTLPAGTASPLNLTHPFTQAGTYTVTATATDKDGGASTTASQAIAITGDSTATVTTGSASGLTPSSETLGGIVTANNTSTTVTFSYGLTTGYGQTATATPSTVTGATATAVSATVSGLQPHTLYHFRVNGTSPAGPLNGADATFTTLNSTPAAIAQSGLTTAEDTAKAITLAVTDADGDTEFAFVVTQPAHGSVALVGNVATYTPAANYNGNDSFTFTANDGFVGGLSTVATVSLSVTAVNDPPVVAVDVIPVAPLLTTLFPFTGTTGANPGAGPGFGQFVQGSDGNLYGMTQQGGLGNAGTVFKITPAGVQTTLVSFTGTSGANPGQGPNGSLVQGNDGNFYGMTSGGGTNDLGTIFKMTAVGVRTTLVNLTGSGPNSGTRPNGSLVQGSDGNFYGMTQQGGTNSFGTIFKMTPAGVQTTLVNFTGASGANPGSNPNGSLVQGSDGDFYGMTVQGGTSNFGTIFKMTAAGVQTTLVNFTGGSGANPGSSPNGSLVQGSDGNSYGMTYGGGTTSLGTIFKMTPFGTRTTLVNFTGDSGANPGSHPCGSLVLGNDGSFYGMTNQGGTSTYGTVFRVTTTGGQTTLANFTNSGTSQGQYPVGSLVQGSDGNFYGMTGQGGPSGNGTVFRIGVIEEVAEGATGTQTGTFSDPDGNETVTLTASSGTLTQDNAAGTWTWTAAGVDGPASSTITITALDSASVAAAASFAFKVTNVVPTVAITAPATGSTGVAMGFTFTATDPGPVDQAAGFAWSVNYGDGSAVVTLPAGTASPLNLTHPFTKAGAYTVTATATDKDGGASTTTSLSVTAVNHPPVVAVDGSAGALVLTTLFPFTGTTGANPGGGAGFGQFVQGSDGNLYGMTQQGGTSSGGTVFKITPAGVQTTLVNFTGNTGLNPGAAPNGSLVQGNDGDFYGMTFGGGTSNLGTIFKVTAAGVQTTLVNLTGGGANPGTRPNGSLVQGSDGNFYGMTQQGGASSCGTVFKMTPAGVQTTLVQFTGTSGLNPGKGPNGSLVQGSDGDFYGMTVQGGTGNFGTIFKVTAAGAQTTLVNFTDASGANPGSIPNGSLVRGTDGNFYGMTYGGGTNSLGTVFKMTPVGVRTTLVNFTGDSGANPGSHPYGSLVLGNDGSFYGMTNQGGTSTYGTVFKVTAAGVQTTLVNFTNSGASLGQYPVGSLVQGSNGNFYGMTGQGGPSGRGTVFKIGLGLTVVEGAMGTQTGTFSDPDGNATVTLTASSGTVTQDNAAGTWNWTALGVGAPASTVIIITATDAEGVTAVAGFTFMVTPVDPNAPTLTASTIASNNANATQAKAGDGITLSFTASKPIQTPTVTLAGRTASVSNPSGNNWLATITVAGGDPQGSAAFSIAFKDQADHNGTTVTATTDASRVTIDTAAPAVTPPTNVVIHATSPVGAVANYDSAAATDNLTVSPALAYSQASGTAFANGLTTVIVTATDAAGNAGTASFTVTVSPLTLVETWRYTNFGTAANSGSAAATADPDGDRIVNLLELAFGTNPMSNASGSASLVYAGTFGGGGTVVAVGQPIVAFNGTDYRALFARRGDYIAAGVGYTVEFSADLVTWVASVTSPTVLADNGAMQIVSVPYPPLVNGKPARFFHVVVTVAP